MLATTEGKGKKRRRWLRLFPLVLLLIACANIPLFPSLVIRDAKSNELLWSGRIAEGAAFGLRWTHSIHRSWIEEKYRIRDGQIILSEMSFHDYGIGMENELQPGEQLVMQDGHFRILHMNRPFPALHLRIGQVRADHTLLFSGTEIPLATIHTPGSAITLQVEKRSLLSEMGGY